MPAATATGTHTPVHAPQQVDAFFCFNALLTRHLPRYVTPNLDGVHAGCALIGRVLQVSVTLYEVCVYKIHVYMRRDLQYMRYDVQAPKVQCWLRPHLPRATGATSSTHVYFQVGDAGCALVGVRHSNTGAAGALDRGMVPAALSPAACYRLRYT
jgi:hypothetical protein